MSQSVDEDDTVLKDLVARTLQNNGALGKIQRDVPLCNQHTKKLLSTPAGCLAASLIHDFFTCLGLDFTLSVYGPESNLTAGAWKLHSRDALLQLLGLGKDEEPATPVLYTHCSRHQCGAVGGSPVTTAGDNTSTQDLTDPAKSSENPASVNGHMLAAVNNDPNCITNHSKVTDRSHDVSSSSASTPVTVISSPSIVTSTESLKTSTNLIRNTTTNTTTTTTSAASNRPQSTTGSASESSAALSSGGGGDSLLNKCHPRPPLENILAAPPAREDDSSSSNASSHHSGALTNDDRLWVEKQDKSSGSKSAAKSSMTGSDEVYPEDFSSSSSSSSSVSNLPPSTQTRQSGPANTTTQLKETNQRLPIKLENIIITEENAETEDELSLQDLLSTDSSSGREETDDMTASAASVQIDYQESV